MGRPIPIPTENAGARAEERGRTREREAAVKVGRSLSESPVRIPDRAVGSEIVGRPPPSERKKKSRSVKLHKISTSDSLIVEQSSKNSNTKKPKAKKKKKKTKKKSNKGTISADSSLADKVTADSASDLSPRGDEREEGEHTLAEEEGDEGKGRGRSPTDDFFRFMSNGQRKGAATNTS